jgi:hypothetical protein
MNCALCCNDVTNGIVKDEHAFCIDCIEKYELKLNAQYINVSIPIFIIFKYLKLELVPSKTKIRDGIIENSMMYDETDLSCIKMKINDGSVNFSCHLSDVFYAINNMCMCCGSDKDATYYTKKCGRVCYNCNHFGNDGNYMY